MHRHGAVLLGSEPPQPRPRGQVREDAPLEPAYTALYEGLRIYLTKNFEKQADFVNRMTAEVQHYNDERKCVEVITQNGKCFTIHLNTEEVENVGTVI